MARKYNQGRFFPRHPEKYVGDLNNIVYRSDWERVMMVKCDTTPNVVKWNSEGVVIPYWSPLDHKTRRYFVDFMVQVRKPDGSLKTYLIEVKPEAQCKPPTRGKGKRLDVLAEQAYTYSVNQAKWEAAKKYAVERGMEFMVFTERDLGIKK